MTNASIALKMRALLKPLRPLRGFRLLAGTIRRRFTGSGVVVAIDDFDGDLRMRLALSEHMQSQIFWYGYYSRDVCAVVKKLLDKGDIVVDAGANIGEISLVAAKAVGKDGCVYAFEPVTSIADRLAENIEANRLENVRLLRFGLADEERTVPIFAAAGAFHDGSENSGLGTLFATSQRSAKIENIRLTTLDRYWDETKPQRMDLVKIDVEGAELAVLMGARNCLERFKPYLVIEVQTDTAEAAGYRAAAILEFLEPMGYRFHRIARNGRLRELTAQTLGKFQNVLCTPLERPAPEW